MRRLAFMAALGVLSPPATSHADTHTLTLSAGYNETALTSALNRGTMLQTQITRGRQVYAASFANTGLSSFGIGRISSGTDLDRNINRYPMLSAFAQPGTKPGVAAMLHQEWYWRGGPTRTPGRFLTVFQTEGGVVWQGGHAPKVRVAHRFVTSERRFPGRSRGAEWVWEFRRDFPAGISTVADLGHMKELERRTMRFENWAFFTHELGSGVLRLNIGATHKTVVRSEGSQGGSLWRSVAQSGDGLRRVPVLMARIAYIVRPW